MGQTLRCRKVKPVDQISFFPPKKIRLHGWLFMQKLLLSLLLFTIHFLNNGKSMNIQFYWFRKTRGKNSRKKDPLKYLFLGLNNIFISMRKFTGKTIRETKNTRVGGESLEKCMSPHLLTACMLVPFLFFCRAADGTGSLMNFVVCPKQGIFGGLCDTQTNMMQQRRGV